MQVLITGVGVITEHTTTQMMYTQTSQTNKANTESWSNSVADKYSVTDIQNHEEIGKSIFLLQQQQQQQ